MSIVEGIALILGGGVGVEIVRAIVRGLREHWRARGRTSGEREALQAARQQWIEQCYELRRAALAAGAEIDDLPTTDAYSEWQKRQLTTNEDR